MDGFFILRKIDPAEKNAKLQGGWETMIANRLKGIRFAIPTELNGYSVITSMDTSYSTDVVETELTNPVKAEQVVKLTRQTRGILEFNVSFKVLDNFNLQNLARFLTSPTIIPMPSQLIDMLIKQAMGRMDGKFYTCDFIHSKAVHTNMIIERYSKQIISSTDGIVEFRFTLRPALYDVLSSSELLAQEKNNLLKEEDASGRAV